MKIILGGPPHSGKSCLRYGLKEAIKNLETQVYPCVITACPDGEGSWFHETANNDEDNAKALKAEHKKAFGEEQTETISRWVKECNEPLVFVDVGGRVDVKNERICATATHAILIAGNLDELGEWRTFCTKLNIQIIAEIHSDYHGTTDSLIEQCEDKIYRGTVHRLERGDLTIPVRPTVQKLAEVIINMQKETEVEQMATYKISLIEGGILRIGFGEPAQNDRIVLDAECQLKQLTESGRLAGGPIIKVNGPASLPAGMVIAHHLAHLYETVACYDPKLSKYVVVITHGDTYQIGDLLS